MAIIHGSLMEDAPIDACAVISAVGDRLRGRLGHMTTRLEMDLDGVVAISHLRASPAQPILLDWRVARYLMTSDVRDIVGEIHERGFTVQLVCRDLDREDVGLRSWLDLVDGASVVNDRWHEVEVLKRSGTPAPLRQF